MKPGQTVYFFDNEGAANKADIALKKTVSIESTDGTKETVKYTLEGKSGEYEAGNLFNSLRELISEVTRKLT